MVPRALHALVVAGAVACIGALRGPAGSVRSAPTRVAAGKASFGAAVVGCGSALPEPRLTNDALGSVVDTSDEWIASRTGIRARHLLAPGGSLAALAAEAGSRALLDARVDPGTVDLVIVATSSPDDLFGDAPAVAHACGCENAAAFDLTAACSGFLFGLVTAAQFLDSGAYGTVLVVGADALSRWVDWDDRNTCVLFGDGAGAVVLRASEKPGVLGFAMRSDGAGASKLTCAYDGGSPKALGSTGVSVSSNGAYGPTKMDGKAVYVFACRAVPAVLTEALESAGLGVDDIDWLLLHQANARIIEAVAKSLGVPMAKVLSNLDETGNTSAGSIPLALDAARAAGKLKPGDTIACAGFGAGLSWGAAVFKWGGSSPP